MEPADRFTPDYTADVLAAACEAAGLDHANATLIRLGENALYRLKTAPFMVRVGRSLPAAQKEVAVARWLESQSFPAARVADVPQPVVYDDTPVTFWQYIEQSAAPVTSRDLGVTLRRLHALPAPPVDLVLPQFEPMPKVADRLTQFGHALAADDREFLWARKLELEERMKTLRWQLGYGPIHGDAHEANLMRDRTGSVQLIDFEDFCYGPREWDVCVETVRFAAFEWLTKQEYKEYVEAYGFDPLEWDGFQTVRAVRELNMTTWLIQLAGHSVKIDDEITKRVADLRDGDSPRRWQAF